MTAWIARILLSVAVFATLPSDTKSLTHVLDRTSFGARPGDLERIRALGVERYIEDQLHPERLADPGVDVRLAGLTTLGMSSRQIAEQFERPALEARRAAQAAGGDGQPPREQQQRAATVMQELQQQKVIR